MAVERAWDGHGPRRLGARSGGDAVNHRFALGAEGVSPDHTVDARRIGPRRSRERDYCANHARLERTAERFKHFARLGGNTVFHLMNPFWGCNCSIV